jgi:hypothetical protein
MNGRRWPFIEVLLSICLIVLVRLERHIAGAAHWHWNSA